MYLRSLISEDMIREFLFPYYSRLLTNVKARQINKSHPLHDHAQLFVIAREGVTMGVVTHEPDIVRDRANLPTLTVGFYVS
jgi:hypothetical protein